MQVRKQQLELDMDRHTDFEGSRVGDLLYLV